MDANGLLLAHPPPIYIHTSDPDPGSIGHVYDDILAFVNPKYFQEFLPGTGKVHSILPTCYFNSADGLPPSFSASSKFSE